MSSLSNGARVFPLCLSPRADPSACRCALSAFVCMCVEFLCACVLRRANNGRIIVVLDACSGVVRTWNPKQMLKEERKPCTSNTMTCNGAYYITDVIECRSTMLARLQCHIKRSCYALRRWQLNRVTTVRTRMRKWKERKPARGGASVCE